MTHSIKLAFLSDADLSSQADLGFARLVPFEYCRMQEFLINQSRSLLDLRLRWRIGIDKRVMLICDNRIQYPISLRNIRKLIFDIFKLFLTISHLLINYYLHPYPFYWSSVNQSIEWLLLLAVIIINE